MMVLKRLESDHKTILKTLDKLQGHLDQDTPISQIKFRELFDQFVGFFQDHTDLEENVVFSAFPRPLSVDPHLPFRKEMLSHDHRSIAKALEQVERDLDGENDALLLEEHFRGFADLLRGHIQEEDYILFPAMEKFLNRSTQDKISKESQRVRRTRRSNVSL